MHCSAPHCVNHIAALADVELCRCWWSHDHGVRTSWWYCWNKFLFRLSWFCFRFSFSKTSLPTSPDYVGESDHGHGHEHPDQEHNDQEDAPPIFSRLSFSYLNKFCSARMCPTIVEQHAEHHFTECCRRNAPLAEMWFGMQLVEPKMQSVMVCASQGWGPTSRRPVELRTLSASLPCSVHSEPCSTLLCPA